ncbi:hypothetical protein PG999_000261 [Apiospora kogelbergensis]|uniref:Uncharacterized protein n=1 Tax=Apiospora kogelbergensis TaxID=1337665 RepID=A0AAW0RB81_9PEZI
MDSERHRPQRHPATAQGGHDSEAGRAGAGPGRVAPVGAEARTKGTCADCTEKLKAARKDLSDAQRDVWAARLDAASEEAFGAVFAVEKQLVSQFRQACKKACREDRDIYHTEPLATHRRKARQLLLCANEMQREVARHKVSSAQVVERAIHVLGKEFIMVDVWKYKSDSDLRDGLEIAMPGIMRTVLAMRSHPDLDGEIRDTMSAEFGKALL